MDGTPPARKFVTPIVLLGKDRAAYHLGTLVPDDHWCVAPHFPALNCILKHSPVLEKLTLQLFFKI
jgi:hypothetical protein